MASEEINTAREENSKVCAGAGIEDIGCVLALNSLVL
jgi:hypothetical protein